MHPFLPAWADATPALHARLEAAIDPDGKILGAIERIVPISGKRIADIGTGIGHYPMLLARRTGRTYGVESDPELLAEARRRAAEAHQPNIRIIEGEPTALPLRDGAVDIVLTSLIDPDDASLPAVAEALRVLRPDGRLIVIGFYGRDDVSALLEPEVVEHAREATQRRTGWWLRNGFKIKVVHAKLDLGDSETAHELLPRLYGDRGRAFLMGPHRRVLRLNLGLFHRAATPIPGRSVHAPTARQLSGQSLRKNPCDGGSPGRIIRASEGQARLPPEPGLWHCPHVPYRCDTVGLQRQPAVSRRPSHGNHHAAHEDHVRDALRRQRGAPVLL